MFSGIRHIKPVGLMWESLPTVFLSRENDVAWDFLTGTVGGIFFYEDSLWGYGKVDAIQEDAYGKIVIYETAHSGDGDM